MLNPQHVKAWLNFEVEKRADAMDKPLDFPCPYPTPEDVHKVRKLDGTYSKQNKLGIQPYELFYMTRDQYLDDINYLEEIYKYFKLSELRVNHAWVWGKYYWVKHFVSKNKDPAKSYKDICGLARKTELSVRRLLYEYVEDCRRVDDNIQ